MFRENTLHRQEELFNNLSGISSTSFYTQISTPIVAIGDIVLSSWSSNDRLLKKPSEHKTTTSGIASIESERKLFQVGLQVVRNY